MKTHLAYLTRLKEFLYLTHGNPCHVVSLGTLSLGTLLYCFVGCACVGCVQVSVAQNGDYLMFKGQRKPGNIAEETF